MTVPTPSTRLPRPPVITVMGHIDHGKSSLLDYIRKTNVVGGEAGGITQHISAYEFEHETQDGKKRRLTFLDTPGHEAFQHLRERGSQAADIAILVVAADDGVMPQTRDALAAIRESNIPFVVAITKIDKTNAQVERAKSSLLEAEVYPEGMGGDVPCALVSSKTGEGIDTLLDLVVLAADMEEITMNPQAPAEGVVIESQRDKKRGISATLIVKNGTLHAGECVVAGSAWAPVRIFEDFRGKSLKEATASSPVAVVGFSDVPPVGEAFSTVSCKKDAEACCAQYRAQHAGAPERMEATEGAWHLPVILKADVAGSLEALKHELKKCETDAAKIIFMHEGVGRILESDVKLASASESAVVLGFAVSVDPAARDMAERLGISIATFDIIYRVSEWAETALETMRPRKRVEVLAGKARILKTFSRTKGVSLVGIAVEEGACAKGMPVRLWRRGEALGSGKLVSLQEFKQSMDSVEAGKECGAQVSTSVELAPGDVMECVTTVMQ